MIYIASDHAGFELKNTVFNYLKEQGLEVEDVGPFVFNKDDDYPDFIYPCAVKVAEGQPDAKGIVIGRSGNGEAMVANKVRGVRAAVYYGGNKELIRLSRSHNDANILSLGAGFVSPEEIKEVVGEWLKTPFAGGRHESRVNKIIAIDSQK